MNTKSHATILLLLAALSAPASAANLYNENSYRPLASDKRAHLPGDVLTINIMENSSAMTSADTALQRNNSIAVQAGLNQRTQAANVAVNNNFDGGGTVQRTGQLLAQMTVTVVKVLANGDLWIQGEQLLEINSDKQKIKVEGRVRPLDISDTNTVISYRIADAKISYLGDGDLASRQKPGFWSRLFTMIGL